MSNQQKQRGKSRKVTELPEEALELIRQYEEAKADEEEGAGRKEDAINKLMEMLGDNEIGKIDDYVISIDNITVEAFDTNLFNADNPELYKKYLTKSYYKQLTIE